MIKANIRTPSGKLQEVELEELHFDPSKSVNLPTIVPAVTSHDNDRAIVEIIEMDERIIIKFDRALMLLNFSLEEAEGFANSIMQVIEEVRGQISEEHDESG